MLLISVIRINDQYKRLRQVIKANELKEITFMSNMAREITLGISLIIPNVVI